ncbi:MAG TPA: alpha/beta fold hydrolase [Bacteroidetes bacterium]|nr:alpha/beta fold hydrolase [Bacteroidota bacterium]
MAITETAHRLKLAGKLLPVRKLAPESPWARMIFAHGAGAGMDSDFMRFFQRAFAAEGLETVCFEFGYMAAGRKAPAPRQRLEEEFRAVVREFGVLADGLPLLLVGKSMGGRIASYIAGEFPAVQGLVFLGYPLHPPGRPGVQRAEHLLNLPLPMCFVSGQRDRLAETELLLSVIRRLDDRACLSLVEDGDHSLRVPKRSGRSVEEVWTEASLHAVNWIRAVVQAERKPEK